MKDKKLKNIYVYDTYDDLLKSLSNHEFTLSKNWNEPKLPNQDTHDFEIIIQRSFAFSILHSDLGIPKDKIIIDDIIGHIFKNIDVNTGIVYRLKIVGYFNSDLGSLTHGFTTKDSVSKLNVETKRRLQINTRNALKSDKTLKLTNDYLLETLELSPDQIMDWQDGNEVIVNLVYVERISLVLIQILTAIAISIGIANVIAFDAKEKTKQIGILKALGITNNKAVSIFHIQATIISVFAIISGIVLGNLVSKLFPLVFKSSYGVPLIYPNQSVFNYWSVLTIIVMILSNQLGMYIPGLSIKSLSIIEVIKGD